MAKGKYERIISRQKRPVKGAALFLSIALLLTLAAGGTIAYVIRQTNSLENRFEAGCVASSVNVEGKVTNDGNVDAYIRAAVVVNWMDGSGNVYGLKPSCTISANEGWIEKDGFFYYTSPLGPEETTKTAPASVGETGEAPSDAYSLSIEIVAEAIQAEGMGASAATDAWPTAGGD